MVVNSSSVREFSVLDYFKERPYVDFAGDKLTIFSLSNTLAINTRGRVRYCKKNKTWYGYDGKNWLTTDAATVLHGIHMAVWAAERYATESEREQLKVAEQVEEKEPGRYSLYMDGAEAFLRSYKRWAEKYTEVKFLKDVLWLMKQTNIWLIYPDEVKQHVFPEALRHTQVDKTATIISEVIQVVNADAGVNANNGKAASAPRNTATSSSPSHAPVQLPTGVALNGKHFDGN